MNALDLVVDSFPNISAAIGTAATGIVLVLLGWASFSIARRLLAYASEEPVWRDAHGWTQEEREAHDRLEAQSEAEDEARLSELRSVHESIDSLSGDAYDDARRAFARENAVHDHEFEDDEGVYTEKVYYFRGNDYFVDGDVIVGEADHESEAAYIQRQIDSGNLHEAHAAVEWLGHDPMDYKWHKDADAAEVREREERDSDETAWL